MHQIFGPDGAGKDYLSNLVIAQVQKEFGDKANIAWMSFGYPPDIPFMEMAGVDVSLGNLLFIDVDSGDGLDKPAESLLSAVIRLIKSNKLHLVIINELGSGETKDNVVKDLHEDARIATWASLMSDFCRKFYSAMRYPDEEGNPNQTTVLMINPVRANMNAHTSRYSPYVQGGGYALKHAKAIDIHLRAGQIIKAGRSEKIGKVINWKISKGKHGVSEGAEGSYNFMFDKGVDLVADLVNAAKAYGVVRSSGPVYYVLDYEDKIKGGIDGVVEMVKKSPSLQEEIRAAVLEQVDNG